MPTGRGSGSAAPCWRVPPITSRSMASSRPSLTTIVEMIARSAPARIKRRVRRDPVRAESRRIPQCFNEIGLAVAVRADEYGAARLEVQLDLRP